MALERGLSYSQALESLQAISIVWSSRAIAIVATHVVIHPYFSELTVIKAVISMKSVILLKGICNEKTSAMKIVYKFFIIQFYQVNANV